MSYAQRHRSRQELHQSSLGGITASLISTPLHQTPSRQTASVVSDHAVQQHHQSRQQPPVTSENKPQRSNSSLLRAHAARIQQGNPTGIDIAAWSEAATNAVAGDRLPFQLLQRTPPKSEPPRLKASRKQFASPHISTDALEGSQSVPVSLPIVVHSDSPEDEHSKHDAGPDPLATDLRTDQPSSAPPPAVAAEDPAPSQEETDQHSDALAAGEMSPSPIPVSHQPSQPQQPFAESSAPSSARMSASQWPASETFTARLKNIMETRQQIEALVQKQREDEEEMIHAIATLDEQSQLHQSQQQLPSSPDSAAPGSAGVDAVHRRAYEQVLMERDAAFAALREFKEKGNAIVHHLYDTVKSQQEQSLELVATVEALKKANKRLREAVSDGGRGRTGGSAVGVPETVAELEQKVLTQRRVIEQMDQLMQSADRMLLAMRARVEAAERRAASSAPPPPLDRRQLPPLPKAGARPASLAAEGGLAPLPAAAAVSTPDAVGAIERVLERYPADQDLATVAVQQKLLLDRIAQLRHSLKQEEKQRLHLEEVYGATSEETAKNVALLEERLQRAENPRGVPFNGGNPATNASALRDELHTLLEGSQYSLKAAPQAAEVADETAEEGEKPPPDTAAMHSDVDVQRPPTPSSASSPASSRSSTPTRTLFTAVSVGDANTTTAANEVADVGAAKKTAPTVVAISKVNGVRSAEKAKVADPETPPPSGQGKKDESPLPVPQATQEDRPQQQQQQQPRAFLSRQRSAGSDKGNGAAVAVLKAPLGIPVPDPSSLGNSLPRSFNSRSSSASRRLVDYRPAVAADATSRGLESTSDEEEDGEESSTEADEAPVEVGSQNSRRNDHSDNDVDSRRVSSITGVTPTITPTAIHSASSPLPDTSTSAELSAKRQQRLHRQKEELDKLEADVTSVVRSLDIQ